MMNDDVDYAFRHKHHHFEYKGREKSRLLHPGWNSGHLPATFCGFCSCLQNALTSIVIPQLEIMMMIMMAGMRMMIYI